MIKKMVTNQLDKRPISYDEQCCAAFKLSAKLLKEEPRGFNALDGLSKSPL